MHAETEHSGPGGEDRYDNVREPGSPRALGSARLLPAVTFGLRAAVLAGVVVVSSPVLPQASGATAQGSAVMTTTTLNGPISALSAYETTCCGNYEPPRHLSPETVRKS